MTQPRLASCAAQSALWNTPAPVATQSPSSVKESRQPERTGLISQDRAFTSFSYVPSVRCGTGSGLGSCDAEQLAAQAVAAVVVGDPEQGEGGRPDPRADWTPAAGQLEVDRRCPADPVEPSHVSARSFAVVCLLLRQGPNARGTNCSERHLTGPKWAAPPLEDAEREGTALKGKRVPTP